MALLQPGSCCAGLVMRVGWGVDGGAATATVMLRGLGDGAAALPQRKPGPRWRQVAGLVAVRFGGVALQQPKPCRLRLVAGGAAAAALGGAPAAVAVRACEGGAPAAAPAWTWRATSLETTAGVERPVAARSRDGHGAAATAEGVVQVHQQCHEVGWQLLGLRGRAERGGGGGREVGQQFVDT